MNFSRNTFHYRPLSKGSLEELEIRLICLHPGDSDDPIHCTIYHVTLRKGRPNSKYIALSYVWGDAAQTKPIHLGYHQPSKAGTLHAWSSDLPLDANRNEIFQVTTNLESGLRHLRDPTVHCVLWIDAICINQSNVEEVRSQVKIMGDVYQNAVKVHIWLGSIGDVYVSTPEIQEKIEDYQSRQDSLSRRALYSFSSPQESMEALLGSEEKIIEVALLAAQDHVMDEGHFRSQETVENWFPDGLESLGMQIIALRPWWRRVWVLQEATLSKEDPDMQCGHIIIKYRRFLESAKHCMVQSSSMEISTTNIFLTVHGMFDKGYDPSEISQADRLLTYLGCMSGNFEATNPRDRINGLNGLLRMGACHDNIFFLMMENQYERDLPEHYHLVAIWILFDPHPRSYPLRLLENGPSHVEGVPSWVPMWESKKWIGESKNRGAPESAFDILAQGTAMGNIHHQSSIDICPKCTEMYMKKWGAPKSIFDIAIKGDAIRIRNALALGRVITVVEVPPVQGKRDRNSLQKALVEVEGLILAALKAMKISHASARTHILRFRDYIRFNFWNVDSGKVPGSSERSMTLEDFLQHKGESRRRKGQRRGRKVSAHQADLSTANPPSVAKLSHFFRQVSHLLIGSNIVGHVFEDSLPSWRCGDRLFLIPECRWILGLQYSGKRYRYMYRVFVSDLEWEQRKKMFDENGIYEDIVLV